MLIIVYFRPYFFTNCLSFRLITSMSHGYLRKSQNIDLDSFFLNDLDDRKCASLVLLWEAFVFVLLCMTIRVTTSAK